VTITYPASGIRVARGVKMSITANASDKVGVALVRTYVDGSVICEQKIAPSYSYSYSCPWTPASRGKTNIQVQALDSTGNAAVASVSVFPR
jgi:Bacterial Ig domain